ncbi:hypothetical protein SALB_07327 [Streptomyces noursei]|uniref:Uncharacterized protein n=1 Tax=Streptomyces noursei TaxID=1971 RepID=A0A401RAB4_STRNR|nr:hypothetical protein SALB_07327 [Streptomyces noursei]
MGKGKGRDTIRVAKAAGDRDNNGRGKAQRQEVLGTRHSRQTHICKKYCDKPCPLNPDS